jgi:hypothetical protein
MARQRPTIASGSRVSAAAAEPVQSKECRTLIAEGRRAVSLGNAIRVGAQFINIAAARHGFAEFLLRLSGDDRPTGLFDGKIMARASSSLAAPRG